MRYLSNRRSPIFRAVVILACVVLEVSATALLFADEGSPSLKSARAFLRANCFDCHEGSSAEAGLDLSKLGNELSDPTTMRRWVQIVDRVDRKEMPPPEMEQPTALQIADFIGPTSDWLRDFQSQQHEKLGRVRSRRLTRREVERSLHDLLGIDIPLQHLLAEDSRTNGFSTVADGQAMSHFQMAQHLATVDVALDEAFRRALSAPDEYRRDFDAKGIARTNPRRRCREPEMLNGKAVVWNGGVTFYGRLPATTAPADGWYRFKVKVAGLNLPSTGGVWSTVNTGLCVSGAPQLTHVFSFEAMAEPKTVEFVTWLPRFHLLEIRPGDVTLKRARFAGGQIGTGEGEPQNVPGIAIESLSMERIHVGPDDDEIRRLLVGDAEITIRYGGHPWRVESKNRHREAEPLMLAFARRAFRRPVTKDDISGYLEMVNQAIDDGARLNQALRIGYRAMLCSPRFLYLTEHPGRLDDHAIAARLSYFLLGTTPDATLSKLADMGKLTDKTVLRSEAKRLLQKGQDDRRFVTDFAAQWLELDQIDFTQPDRRSFPKFDAIVQQAMLDETHEFLQTLLDENLSIAHLVDGDFTFLDSRLARYYQIDDVQGDQTRKVLLPAEHHRGGLLTQGAILKVTANGSNTSPVLRGVWVSERILGVSIPPPPDNIPAIEPDIRGAKTIREQLEKHRSQQSCAVCHVHIDPPGYALENFDPAGQFRTRYRSSSGGNRKSNPTIDASYKMPDGREFSDIVEFRSLVADRPRQLAENLAEKLLTYGTGAPISFVDRKEIELIVDEAEKEDYGVRSILLAVICSDTFLTK